MGSHSSADKTCSKLYQEIVVKCAKLLFKQSVWLKNLYSPSECLKFDPAKHKFTLKFLHTIGSNLPPRLQEPTFKKVSQLKN